MTVTEVLLVVLIMVWSATVSAVAGFGFGLMSVPLMSLAVDVRRAVVLSTLLGMAVTLYQAWTWHRHARRPLVLRTLVAAYAGMPLGLWLFVNVDAKLLKWSLGIAVLAAVVLLIRRIDLRHSGAGLDLGAGFLAGVLSTSLSTNGPPLVFSLQARRLTPDEFRGTLSMIFAGCNVASLAAFAIEGQVTASALGTSAMTVPGVIGGLYVGGRLRPKVNAAMFRRLVLVLLTAAGVAAIATA